MKRGILIGAILLGTFANAEVNESLCNSSLKLAIKANNLALEATREGYKSLSCYKTREGITYMEIALGYCNSELSSTLAQSLITAKQNEKDICE